MILPFIEQDNLYRVASTSVGLWMSNTNSRVGRGYRVGGRGQHVVKIYQCPSDGKNSTFSTRPTRT